MIVCIMQRHFFFLDIVLVLGKGGEIWTYSRPCGGLCDLKSKGKDNTARRAQIHFKTKYSRGRPGKCHWDYVRNICASPI